MARKLVGLNLAMLALLVVGGCCEQEKKQLSELQMNKQDLEAEVQRLKDELNDKQADLEKLQAQLDALTGQRGQLQSQLDALRRQQANLPKGWEIRKGMAMTSIQEEVLFDSGRAVLKTSARSALNNVLRQIKQSFPGKDVYIIGHTDTDPIRRTRGQWQDNLDLSLNRAAAVTRYMTSAGLGAKQVVTGGVGEFRPVASNATRAGKTKNRRVEFWILKPL